MHLLDDFEEFKTTRLKLPPLVIIFMGKQLVEALRYKPKVASSIPDGVIANFIGIILIAAL